jgi:4'-phosphopantetheinyl transferase
LSLGTVARSERPPSLADAGSLRPDVVDRLAAVRPGRPPVLWVRRIDLGAALAIDSVAAGHLTPTERLRADRGTDAVRRRRILLRAGLRQFLGELLGLPPAAVPLIEQAGRPLLDGSLGFLHVSCSAAGKVGLVAIAAGTPVGIDVEVHRDGDALVASDEGWLCPAEERQLRRVPPDQRRQAATRCWTQKEAVLKGLGVGLDRHPRTVATPMAATGRVGEWWTVPVPVATGHVASAAIRTELDDVTLLVEDMTVGEA